MIKIINCRKNIHNSLLFHYAHFICDCVFPEFFMKLFNKHKIVYRLKGLRQCLGNFSRFYKKIFKINTIEVPMHKFNQLRIVKKMCVKKETIPKRAFIAFRNFIWRRFNIKPNSDFPKILLIQRGVTKTLINNINVPSNLLKNGHQRREIEQIDKLKEYLSTKFPTTFKCIKLEGLTFRQQVCYFFNADVIIAAHGAGLSNMFFCRPNTKIIEVHCNRKWYFFPVISANLRLNHSYVSNKLTDIINLISGLILI